MTDIKADSIVKLNSGGPKMTSVEGPDQEGLVECIWFNASKKLEVHRFKLSSLVIVEESENALTAAWEKATDKEKQELIEKIEATLPKEKRIEETLPEGTLGVEE